MSKATKKGKDAKPKNPVEPKDAPRPIQTEIPGTERPRIKALENAAEDYVTKRDTRMQATTKEVEAKTKLSDLMHKYSTGEDAPLKKTSEGELVYRYADMEVRLTPKEEVLKVRHVEDEPSGVVTVGAPKDETEGQ